MAKSRAAEEMLYLLKQLCGFVVTVPTGTDCNATTTAADGSLCLRVSIDSIENTSRRYGHEHVLTIVRSLQLPESVRFKLKVLKHFMVTDPGVPSEDELCKIAALTGEPLECQLHESNKRLRAQYSVSYCRASATAVDESVRKRA